MKPRLEELVRFVLVEEDTGDMPIGSFKEVLGAVLTCFGRPQEHPFPAQLYPLEEDEEARCAEVLPVLKGHVIGRVEWNQGEAREKGA